MLDRELSIHESGHACAAWICGLPIELVTITPEGNSAGHMKLVPKNVACRRLHDFSNFSLHEIRHTPLPRIVDGRPLSVDTSILLFAMCVMMLAGGEAERLFCGSHGHDDSDILKSKLMACNVTSLPLQFLAAAAADARRILLAQRSLVEALAEALVVHRTLDTSGIDDVFAGRDVSRRQWAVVVKGAELFERGHGALQARRL